MRVFKHPEIPENQYLNQSSQSLAIQYSILLKEDSKLYRITPWLFCREYINDQLYTFKTGEVCERYGFISTKIKFNKEIHTVGLSFKEIDNIDLFFSYIPNIIEMFNNEAPKNISIKYWKANDKINFLFNDDIENYPPLLGFFSFLVKLSGYFSKWNKNKFPNELALLYTYDSFKILEDPEKYYLDKIKTLCSQKPNSLKNTLKLKLPTHLPEYHPDMHSSMGFLYSQGLVARDLHHRFLC